MYSDKCDNFQKRLNNNKSLQSLTRYRRKHKPHNTRSRTNSYFFFLFEKYITKKRAFREYIGLPSGIRMRFLPLFFYALKNPRFYRKILVGPHARRNENLVDTFWDKRDKNNHTINSIKTTSAIYAQFKIIKQKPQTIFLLSIFGNHPRWLISQITFFMKNTRK